VTILGEAYLLAGRLADAIQRAERALVLSRDCKERGDQAWALRLLGAIATHGHPPSVTLADTHYRQALTWAKALGYARSRPIAMPASVPCIPTTGHWERDHTELSTVIALYRAMAMTFWLPRTEAVLVQVL
jgi:hypothetical protein